MRNITAFAFLSAVTLASAACRSEPYCSDDTEPVQDENGDLTCGADNNVRLQESVNASVDMDNNSYDDTMQSFLFGFNTTQDVNIMWIVAGVQTYGGSAPGQDQGARGYGNNEYSSEELGWEENFVQFSQATDSAGRTLYGFQGLRDGDYEITFAASWAEVGTVDGWDAIGSDIRYTESGVPMDETGYLLRVKDGTDAECPRPSWHFRFSVDQGYFRPETGRLTDADSACF